MALVELIRFPTRKQAEDLSFILQGGDIFCRLQTVQGPGNGHGSYWAVLVFEHEVERARAVMQEEGVDRQAPVIPLRPTLKKPRLHWVVGLAVLNVLVWIAMEGRGGSENHKTLRRFGASFAPSIREGQIWRTVTAVFLHIGARHLLANMITLMILGPAVLGSWGIGRFYFMYLAAGVAGNWISFALSSRVSIKAGASGSILGLLGVLAGTRIRSIRAPQPDAPPSRFKTWHILAMLLAFYGFVIGIGQVDHLAHLGGLACGIVLALVVPPPGSLEGNRERIVEVALGSLALLVAGMCGLLAYVSG